MKASTYFNYTSRSLLRGGQRTILAVKQMLFELIPLLGIKVIQKIPFRGFLADCLMVIH